MSENFLTNDGFKPLPLPTQGDKLLPGRQYYLDPVSRCTVEDVYGLRGIPSIVECTRAQRAATRVRTVSTNLETGHENDSSVILEGQDATFRAFMAHKRALVFTLNLSKITELRPFYVDSPKLPRYLETDENPGKGEKARGLVERALKKINLSILD